MKDDDLHFLLGSLKSDLEHIKKTTDATNEKITIIDERVGTLESWRNGLVIASATIGTMLVGLGVSVKSALSALLNHQ